MNPAPFSRAWFARYGLAWLSIPMFLSAILALWVADVRVVWSVPAVSWLVHYGSTALGVVFIAIPAARSFLSNGQAGVLMLGCAVLMTQIGVAAMPTGVARSMSAGFAIYNTSVLLSALCHFTGVAIISRRTTRLRRPAAWLTAVYGGGAAAMGLVIRLALTDRMPAFFVEGEGGTLLRSLVVGAAVALFVLTAGLLWQAHLRAASPFLHWYALGLVLLATGLTGSMAIAVLDSPLQWATRFTQFFGLVYMCVAVLASARESGVKGRWLAPVKDAWPENPLLAGLRQRTLRGWALRYGLAVGAVAAAFVCYRGAAAWVGSGLPPFVTFYPAIMLVALLGGLWPGLVATVLAGFVAAYWILPPAGQLSLASPVDRLGLAIFTGMGLVVSVVSELYQRARNKAAAYDRESALREARREKELLANLLEHASQPFAVGYADGRLGRLNRAFEQLTGYSTAELHTLDWSATLTPPEWRETEKQKLDELQRTGRPVRYEKEYLRKDGSRVPIELLVHLTRDAEGKPDYYYSFLTDITDRRRAEQAERASAEHLRRSNAELQAANASILDSRTAAMNLMDDAIAARQRAEQTGAELRQKEAELREAQRVAHFGHWYWDAETDATTGSEELLRIYGLDPATQTMPDFREQRGRLYPPDEWERVNAAVQQSLRTGDGYELDVRALRDGAPIWLTTRCEIVRGAGGRIIGLRGTVQDITERKLAEEAQKRLAQFPQENPNPVLRIADDGALLYANSGAKALLAAMGGAPDHSLPAAVLALAADAGRQNHAVGEAEILDESGRTFWFTATRPPGESYVNLYGRDVTARKQAEEELRRNREWLSVTLTSIGDGVIACDAEGRITFVNPVAASLAGWGAEEALGQPIRRVFNIVNEATRRPAEDLVARVLAERRPAALGNHTALLAKDGHEVPIEDSAAPILDGTGNLAGVVIVFHDVTQKRRTQEALRESEERYRSLFRNMVEGFALHEIITDADGAACDYRFLDVNPGFERLTGLTAAALIGRTVREALPGIEPYWIEKYGKVALTGEPATFESYTAPLDRWYEVFAYRPSPRRFAVIFMDITARRSAEQRLREAQKLESVGLLAGGIAHDFNNLLVGVIGNASLAQEMTAPDSPVAELLGGVLKTGEQLAHLTRQMLAYSGKGRFFPEPLNLSDLFAEMRALVQPSIQRKIELRLELEHGLPPVEADRGQMQQVFMNLVLNAAEAIGVNAGQITVKTGLRQVDDRHSTDPPHGRYICLEVRDTGCGMDDETKARIFDPFFSTKFVGRGLGLAAVSGIVRGHQGAIAVTSAPGKGSCFTVLFPVAENAIAAMPVTPRRTDLSGSGTILVVDDEKAVREIAKNALERQGYRVLLADSGPAAIDVVKRHPGAITLVLLDLSMPGMGGEEVLPALRKIRPTAKVIVSSGYSEAETMKLFDGQCVSGFLQKPFTSTGLAEKVKSALR